MEIPMNAQVECKEGVCGRSVYVLFNPVLEQVTHVVVRESTPPHTEYIVPVEAVSATVAGTIQLSCNKATLVNMPRFVQTEFIKEEMPSLSDQQGSTYSLGPVFFWPYVSPERLVEVQVDHLQVPLGELAVRRGTRVEAADGYVGRVDEFVTTPEGGHITHLVMREGPLWGRKEIIIPVSAMDKSSGDGIVLRLTKEQVAALPTFPLHRRWS